MRVLRLSLNQTPMIICTCRGKSDRDINKLIDNGAATLRDLQRCGIGDQCGSCHNAVRGMLARAAAAAEACPACTPAETPAVATA